MIPAYNQREFISDAIESALSQDYPNLEVIVSDDCSEDDTFEVAKRYKDPRLKCYRNTENLGKHQNYRRLLYEYASGQWCIMLDGDDYFVSRHFISDAMREVGRNTALVLVMGGARVIMQNGTIIEKSPIKGMSEKVRILSGREVFLSWCKEISFYHGAALYKRELATSLKFYSLGLLSDDIASILRLIVHGDVLFLNSIVYVWRKNIQSLTVRSDLKKRVENFKYIDNVYEYVSGLQLFKKNTLKKWKKRMIRHHSQTIAYELVTNRQYEKLPAFMKYLCVHYPDSIFSVLSYFLYVLISKTKPHNKSRVDTQKGIAD